MKTEDGNKFDNENGQEKWIDIHSCCTFLVTGKFLSDEAPSPKSLAIDHDGPQRKRHRALAGEDSLNSRDQAISLLIDATTIESATHNQTQYNPVRKLLLSMGINSDDSHRHLNSYNRMGEQKQNSERCADWLHSIGSSAEDSYRGLERSIETSSTRGHSEEVVDCNLEDSLLFTVSEYPLLFQTIFFARADSRIRASALDIETIPTPLSTRSLLWKEMLQRRVDSRMSKRLLGNQDNRDLVLLTNEGAGEEPVAILSFSHRESDADIGSHEGSSNHTLVTQSSVKMKRSTILRLILPISVLGSELFTASLAQSAIEFLLENSQKGNSLIEYEIEAIKSKKSCVFEGKYGSEGSLASYGPLKLGLVVETMNDLLSHTPKDSIGGGECGDGCHRVYQSNIYFFLSILSPTVAEEYRDYFRSADQRLDCKDIIFPSAIEDPRGDHQSVGGQAKLFLNDESFHSDYLKSTIRDEEILAHALLRRIFSEGHKAEASMTTASNPN